MRSLVQQAAQKLRYSTRKEVFAINLRAKCTTEPLSALYTYVFRLCHKSSVLSSTTTIALENQLVRVEVRKLRAMFVDEMQH